MFAVPFRWCQGALLGCAVVVSACGGGEDGRAPTPGGAGGAGGAMQPAPPACERPGVDCDVTLAPPSRGTQFAIGPFDVAPGTEVLRCFWRKVPTDLDVAEIEIAYNLGSHHLDLFTIDHDMPDGDFDCSDPADWNQWRSEIDRGLDPDKPIRMVVGFQNETIKWRLPDGVAYRLRTGQQLMIQSHYANAATQKTPTARLRRPPPSRRALNEGLVRRRGRGYGPPRTQRTS